jgi:hypothetical protein
MSIEKHMGKMDLDTLKANVEGAAREAQVAESRAKAAADKAVVPRGQASTARAAAEQKNEIVKEKRKALDEVKKRAEEAERLVQEKNDAKAAQPEIDAAQAEATKLANETRVAESEVKSALKEASAPEASAKAAEEEAKRCDKAAADAEQTKTAAQRTLAEAYRALELAMSPCVRFFEAATLKTVEPSNKGVKVSWQEADEQQTGTAPICKWQDELVLDLPKKLRDLLDCETVLVTIRSQVYLVECGGSYVAADVSFLATSGNESCCCVPVAMSPLEQACTLKVHAYDSSRVDFIEHAKSFLDNVEVRVTAMKTPLSAHDASSPFRPVSRSGRTVGGQLEISDLTTGLYEVAVRPPNGYLCETPAIQQLHICGKGTVDLVARLRPCGQDPARSAVFVRKECPGVRWSNSSVEVAGQLQQTDANGMLDLSGLTGVVELKYPDKVFSPAHINLGKAADPVSLIQVADQPASRYPQPSRPKDDDDFFVLNFEKLPPASTEVEVMSLAGEHVAYLTADTGGMYRYPAPGEYDFVVRVGGREVDRTRLKAGRD